MPVYNEDFDIYRVSPAWVQLTGENKMPFLHFKKKKAVLQ